MGKRHIWQAVIIFFVFSVAFQVQAKDCYELSKGQTLYVPAYSHIYIGNKANLYQLTVTLSIRNIDPLNPITLTVVDFIMEAKEN